MDGVVQRLSELLPATFEGLEREFAVGVVTADGQHVLVDKGPLPEAVAASAAIPVIFSSVDVPGACRGMPAHCNVAAEHVIVLGNPALTDIEVGTCR